MYAASADAAHRIKRARPAMAHPDLKLAPRLVQARAAEPAWALRYARALASRDDFLRRSKWRTFRYPGTIAASGVWPSLA